MGDPASDALPQDPKQAKYELAAFLNANPTLKHIYEEAESRRELLDKRQRQIEELEDGLGTIEEEMETLQEAYRILYKSLAKTQGMKKKKQK
jgi:hypothetical protein